MAALEANDRSRGSQLLTRAGGGRTPTPLPEPEGKGLLTLGRLLAFGALAWSLGIILAIIDEAGNFSRASTITVLLLLAILAFLTAIASNIKQTRVATEHILVEAEIRDALTGLPNERYLLMRLEEEITRAQRHERPLTLAVLDINSLAAINDQYGRDCGDEVLRHVATVADETKRASDTLARLNEDEFAVVLAECTAEGGEAFLRRLTERLAREPARPLLGNRPSHVWVGVCVGLAEVQSDEDTAASLLESARANLTSARDERDRRRLRWRTA